MGWSQKKFKNKNNINLIYFYKNNLKKKLPTVLQNTWIHF
jgi:hypothetical protein